MRKDRIFIYVFVALFIIYVIVDITSPKEVSWAVTFRPDDKNPFGSYILNERSTDLFQGGFELSYNTISELEESESNILILTDYADISGTDLDKLFSIVEKGGNVLIGTTALHPALPDSLDFDINFEYQLLNQAVLEMPDAKLVFSDSTEFTYPANLLSSTFELEDKNDWEVLARVQEEPVVISKKVGQGRLTLSSVPHIFTNFGMLLDDNYKAAANILSLLPEANVHYTLFYKSGRREASTPFRFFLREDALRWSLYLGLFIIVLFLVVSSRRKQRAIPVIEPPANTTVEYVKTLGALFFSERNHKKAAIKLINHFISQIKERYFVSVDYSEKFYSQLAGKSGVETEVVIRTFELIQQVKNQPQIEEKTLIDLSKKIEIFK